MEEQLLLLEGRAGAGGDGESLVASEVKKQLYLAGPLIVGCLLQNVVQMISVMFVGHLGELALSSASMAASFAAVTGFSLLLGAGRPAAARLAARVVMLLALAVGASEGLAVLLLRNVWGYAYSNDKEVAGYVARMMPILAISIVFDTIQCVLSGVVRGCGQQKMGAFVNLAAYYIVGIPAAFFFAFFCHLGGMGLWFGILCGLVVQMLLLLTISLAKENMYVFNPFLIVCPVADDIFVLLDALALKAKDRVFNSSLPANMTMT